MKGTVLEIFGLQPQTGVVGIEVEMEGSQLPQRPGNFWIATTDGSLRGEALEYVLRHPVQKSEVLPALEYLDTYLKKAARLTPSDRCGVHIHMNCQDMDTMQVYCFAMLYYVFENLLIRYCGEDREGNLFCLRMQDAEATQDTWKYMASNLNSPYPLNDIVRAHYRYASLNLTSLSKFGSLEFRGLRTPMKQVDIVPWINMLLRIRSQSLTYKHPREIIEGFSATGYDRAMTEILGKEAKLLNYPDKERLISEAIRSIQDIVYTEPLPKKKPKPKPKPVTTATLRDAVLLNQDRAARPDEIDRPAEAQRLTPRQQQEMDRINRMFTERAQVQREMDLVPRADGQVFDAAPPDRAEEPVRPGPQPVRARRAGPAGNVPPPRRPRRR